MGMASQTVTLMWQSLEPSLRELCVCVFWVLCVDITCVCAHGINWKLNYSVELLQGTLSWAHEQMCMPHKFYITDLFHFCMTWCSKEESHIQLR